MMLAFKYRNLAKFHKASAKWNQAFEEFRQQNPRLFF